MAPRPLARGDLHVRLPLAGHEAVVAYAEREGISLNTALWLLVRRGLEHEGIRVEVGGRPGSTSASSVDVEADASAAVERAVAAESEAPRRASADPAPATSGALPPRPGPRRRRGRRR
jgi:hypothetical protein